MKLKELEQTDDGEFFAAAFIDNGTFKIRTFEETTRTPEEIAMEELNVNEALGIDNTT